MDDEVYEKLQPADKALLIDTEDALNGVQPELNVFEKHLVDEYAHSGCWKTTAEALGITKGRAQYAALHNPDIGPAIRAKLDERAARSELKADRVRATILDILDLCPTDYFTKLENGLWCIDPDEFRKVPVEVRRLVESVELKKDRASGDITLNVKFMSKSQALALAAKYTLVEKHDINLNVVPWAQIAGAAEPVKDVDIDALLKEAAAEATTT